MMTTWRDYLLNKSSHAYVDGLYSGHAARISTTRRFRAAPAETHLALNNHEDPLFTVPEMERADRILARRVSKAGASDRYRASFYPGPHKFDRQMQAEAFRVVRPLAQVLRPKCAS